MYCWRTLIPAGLVLGGQVKSLDVWPDTEFRLRLGCILGKGLIVFVPFVGYLHKGVGYMLGEYSLFRALLAITIWGVLEFLLISSA